MQCAADSFRINSATQAAYTKAQIGSNCSEDYIGIEGILELVSKELNHFGVIADLFRHIGDHSSRFVLFCSF